MTRRPPNPALALLPLRLFLGVTFVYAGVQKLADPGYLRSGAATYIGTQLQGFARGTPGGFVLRALALPHPVLAGVGVAVFEIAIGVLAFTGLYTRLAATGGLALNLVLFLTATWNTSPYFLGSDVVFVFAWLPFVLVGAAGQPALDTLLHDRSLTVQVPGGPTLTRRALLKNALAAAGVATVALAGGAVLTRGGYRKTVRRAAGTTSAPPQGAPTTTPTAPGTRIGAADVAPGQAVAYTDPATGGPAFAVREPNGRFAAFSAVCTHAGCTVGYESGRFVCPCHGGVFDAATGAVLGGPPPAPLPRLRVVERNGTLYAQ
jgi:thiosulfate dehydrogenase (quinone) large subunit